MRFRSLLVATLLAGTAIGQVALPPHASVYNGYSRGFNFTSSIPFFIVQLDLPLDAFQAGDTASYLVRINGATALHSVGNAGAIATNIAVLPGDVVDVIANWSPAAAGNFTAHNSYGTGPFATTIEGVPHTLTRTGWQWDIGAPGWVDTGATGTYLAPVAGQLGRVNMFTSTGGSGSVLATNTVVGQGCIQRYASFYELFATPASFDLNNNGITLLPNGNTYIVTSGGAFLPIGSVQAAPTGLVLADDAEVTVPFTVGSFPGPTGAWTGVSVISNGVVSQAPGNSTIAAPAVATMLAAANTAFYSQADFDPSVGGTVWFEESAGLSMITWDNVPSWSVAGSTNTFQVQLYSSGMVVMAWGNMATGGANGGLLVGYSPGGPNLDPGNTDLSALTAPIVLDAGDLPPLQLAGITRPKTGTSWDLQTTNIPATGVIGVDVFGLSDPGLNDLTFLGMPGCGLRASLDLLNAWLVAGATHNYSLAIPNSPALINVHVYTTSAVFQTPAVNAFGAITSNGIDGKIGDL
jgi:hypothetical protein